MNALIVVGYREEGFKTLLLIVRCKDDSMSLTWACVRATEFQDPLCSQHLQLELDIEKIVNPGKGRYFLRNYGE